MYLPELQRESQREDEDEVIVSAILYRKKGGGHLRLQIFSDQPDKEPNIETIVVLSRAIDQIVAQYLMEEKQTGPVN